MQAARHFWYMEPAPFSTAAHTIVYSYNSKSYFKVFPDGFYMRFPTLPIARHHLDPDEEWLVALPKEDH